MTSVSQTRFAIVVSRKEDHRNQVESSTLMFISSFGLPLSVPAIVGFIAGTPDPLNAMAKRRQSCIDSLGRTAIKSLFLKK
jgi:hypothetical protein